MSFVKSRSPSTAKSLKPLEPCEFKKYGCGEMVRGEEMAVHLREQMASHLMLVVEKFEQQIEMNTFMMAHFTEQMEEQVEKSLLQIQVAERRQNSFESKFNDFLKSYKPPSNDPLPRPAASFDPALLEEIKTKQRHQKDAMDAMKTELVHSIDQQNVNLQLLQDRVETNANLLVDRLYTQIQNLEESARQNVESLDKKIEAKEKSHASYHTLQQERFEQEVSSQVAPLGAQVQQLSNKVSRLQDEAGVYQTQLSHVRESHVVFTRSIDRIQADFNLVQVKVDILDKSLNRRSASNLRIDDSDTPSQPVATSPQLSNADIKRLENTEVQIKRVDAAHKTLEQALQDHQTQVDETVREIKTKLTKHEEAISYEEKERERQKQEEKKKFELEEKERSKLEDKIRLEVRERIDKVAGNLTSLEKQHKSLESQAQSTLVEIRDIKEDIEKTRAHNNEVEEKSKLEMKDLKESIEKLKKREKEELKPISPSSVSVSVPDLDQKKKLAEKAQSTSKPSPAKTDSPTPPSPASLHPEPSKAKVAESVAATSSPIIPHIRSDPADVAKYGEKAILWEYDPIGERWMRLVVSLKMEAKPFAEGALRHAFNAEATGSLSPADESQFPHPTELFPQADSIMPLKPGDSLPLRCDAKTSWKQSAKFVIKVYKKDAEQKASRELYFEDVKMQMVCRDWGNKFNQKKPPKRIEFLMAWVVELVDRNPPVLCNMEPLLIGEFKKNNSNFGAVLNTRSTPQSFSHFTYEQSRKDLIIVDIQGVEDHYTDPQIHTSDGKGFGLGNLGKNGIQRFLSTHKCNAVCALLGLSPIGMGSTRKPQLRGTMIMPDIMSHLPGSGVVVGVQHGNSESLKEYARKELKLCHSLQGHRDRISAVCFLPSEGLVCTASADCTIKVFDPNNGWKCLDTLTGHKKAVECLCANDKYLFSGSADQTIKVWDPKRDFRCVQTLIGHKGEISAICVNSKYIISGSFDKSIKIWNVTTFQEVKTLESHTKSVKCLCLAGSYLFSGSNDLLIYVWDLDALAPIFSMEGHEEWVKDVTMAGQSLVSASHDSTIKVWDLREFTCSKTLTGHRDAVVALMTVGPVVYSGSEDNSIKVWDLASLECICTVPKAHPLGVQAFALIDKKLISVSVDGSIKVWEWGLK